MALDAENGDKREDKDLSPFERGLRPDLFDPLEEGEEKRSEGDIIRDIIAELSAKYGIEIKIQDGRELGSEMALNHRLDDLDTASPISIDDEILIAIQENSVSEKQAAELFDNLTDQNELDFKDEKELSRHLFNIYSVLEVVVVDPLGEFDSDIESQSRIISSLQAAADNVEVFIEQKPERDREPLSAKSYLSDQIDRRLSEARVKFFDEYPGFISTFARVADQIQEKVADLPDDLQESRGHLIKILKTYDKIFRIAHDKDWTITEDQKKTKDVLTMISDL